MTNEQVVAVGLRVAGIALLISLLGPFLQLVPVSIQVAATHPFWLVGYGIETAAITGLGILMVARPSRFAKAILPKESHSAEVAGWSLEEFQAVLFSVLGVYLIVTTVTDMSGWWRAWSFVSGNVRSVHWPDVSHIASMATITLKLGAGIWLLLGGRGLASIIQRVRSF